MKNVFAQSMKKGSFKEARRVCAWYIQWDGGSQIEKGDAQQWWENVASIFLISYRNGRSYGENGREFSPLFRDDANAPRSLNYLSE